MVESARQLDLLFGALADTTRRGILSRVAAAEMSISEIADHFKLTYGAISKHIKVLERAGLVAKRRAWKERFVVAVPATLNIAREHIERYASIWADRFDQLDDILREDKTP